MKSGHLKALLLAAGSLVLSACSSGGGKATQFATIDALMAGVYDGEFTCSEVARAGDFGLGTFDRLDGEMVVSGGRVYQVRADGTVHRAPGSMTTPFATVVSFRRDARFQTTSQLGFRALQTQLDKLCPNPNGIYAIRLRGGFPVMKTRSVAPQQKPYPELQVAARGQTLFNLGPADGTVVGFRFPATFKGLNVPGYHFHFLTASRSAGGHVLDLTAAAGLEIEVQEVRRFEVLLPGAGSAFSKARLDRDRSFDLQRVER